MLLRIFVTLLWSLAACAALSASSSLSRCACIAAGICISAAAQLCAGAPDWGSEVTPWAGFCPWRDRGMKAKADDIPAQMQTDRKLLETADGERKELRRSRCFPLNSVPDQLPRLSQETVREVWARRFPLPHEAPILIACRIDPFIAPPFTERPVPLPSILRSFCCMSSFTKP